MTNKEASEILYGQWQEFLENNLDYAGISDAYKMAIKALEQEPILDKIRAEIVEMWQHEPCAIESGCLDEVLEVIDKYKTESEENNVR